MAESKHSRLTLLLENLTTSGKPELDQGKVRELKQICKHSCDIVTAAHAWIVKQLRTKHSEVRLSCLQVIQVLFEKSSRFRELLFSDFEEFLELVTGFALTKKPRELPPPEHIAKRLRSTAIDVVKRWATAYGVTYPRLEIAVRFLDNQTEAVKAHRSNGDADIADVASRREQMRLRALARQAAQARDELEDRKGQIEECLSELRNAVELLVPRLEDFTQTGNISIDSSTAPTERSENAILLPKNYEIVVEINQKSFRLRRTEDNAVVVDTLSERLKQAEQTVLPDLRKWLACFQKSQGFETAVKDCIDYKNVLTQLQNKASTLGIESKKRTDRSNDSRSAPRKDADDDEDDDIDDFVDVSGSSRSVPPMVAGTIDRLLAETEYGLAPASVVPESSEDKTSLSSIIPSSTTPTIGLSKSINCILHPAPTNNTATSSSQKDNSSTDTTKSITAEPQGRSRSNVIPPIIPYGVDLEYWGREDQLTMPDRVAPLDAVWSMQSGEKTLAAELVAATRTRTYAFQSEWKPVEHVCRVPLPNGKLCPRQDRVKCPLHGMIIPRDAVGQPLDPKQAASLSAAQKKGILGHHVKSTTAHQDKPWEDVELLRDIEAQTGVKLTTASSSRRDGRKSSIPGWRNKLKILSNLTDVSAAKKTVTKRLERKLFETKTVKRIGEQMDQEVRKRNDEKFQHQWNYSS